MDFFTLDKEIRMHQAQVLCIVLSCEGWSGTLFSLCGTNRLRPWGSETDSATPLYWGWVFPPVSLLNVRLLLPLLEVTFGNWDICAYVDDPGLYASPCPAIQ